MEQQNILYSTHCPLCTLLETRLKENNIPYTLCEDKETMLRQGFTIVPMFYCAEQNKNMRVQEALLWINRKGASHAELS